MFVYYTDAEQDDSGSYVIDIINDSGDVSCPFNVGVKGVVLVFFQHFVVNFTWHIIK